MSTVRPIKPPRLLSLPLLGEVGHLRREEAARRPAAPAGNVVPLTAQKPWRRS